MKGYWRSILLVLSGAGLAQIIPILGALVIARLYLPGDFGQYSVWLGIVSILSIILSARYEAALVSETDEVCRNNGVLSILVLSVIIVMTLVVVVSSWLVIMQPVAYARLSLLLPGCLAMWGMSISQLWQSWAAANGQYRKLNIIRISQAASVTVTQIAVGHFSASADSLAWAHCFGLLVGVAVCFLIMPLNITLGQSVNSVFHFWLKHHRFPLYSLPGSLVNATAAQLPLLIVSARFGAEVAGLLALTMRVLGGPIGLLGKAVLDVFKRHAAKSYLEKGECRHEYLTTFKVLALASFFSCSFFYLLAEQLFVVAFGEEWRLAGTISIWLLPLFALRFIASPLSYMAYIANKQHIDLIWQVILLVAVLVALGIPASYRLALLTYSYSYALLYMIYLGMSYKYSLGNVCST